MQQTWLLNGYESFQLEYSSRMLDAFASSIPDLSAIYLDYHDNPYSENFFANERVPVFNSIFVERVEEAQGKLLALSSAHPQSPIFAFVGFWAWDFSFAKLKNLTQNLGTEFVFLRPDQFAALYTYFQSPKPLWESMGLVLIPIAALICLIVLWVWDVRKKDSSNKRTLSITKDSAHALIGNLTFLMADWSFLIVSRYLLYSTVLHLFSFLYLLIGLTLGVFQSEVCRCGRIWPRSSVVNPVRMLAPTIRAQPLRTRIRKRS